MRGNGLFSCCADGSETGVRVRMVPPVRTKFRSHSYHKFFYQLLLHPVKKRSTGLADGQPWLDIFMKIVFSSSSTLLGHDSVSF